MIRGGLHEVVKVAKLWEPKTVTATLTDYNGHGYTTGNASGLDIRGYDEAMVELNLGAIAGGNLTVSLLESETDDGTAATAITNAASTAAAFSAKTTADQNKTHLLRIRAKDVKRYLFVKCINDTGDSKAFSINVLLSQADKEPVTQDNTIDFDDSTP